MEIKFFRGDDHQTRFKFINYSGPIDTVYFTVRNDYRELAITKSLGNGIEKSGDYYVITFTPEDTDKLSVFSEMTYDIEIIINGKKYTVAKDDFILEEDITRPTEEVD